MRYKKFRYAHTRNLELPIKCPTCGQSRSHSKIDSAYNHRKRILVRSNERESTLRIRLSKSKAQLKHYRRLSWNGRDTTRTIVICADTFHDQIVEPYVEPESIRRIHHPDLTKNKKMAKRHFQGKDRR